MIVNVNNDEKKISNKITAVVGKPFSFSERLRMKGNGSPRFTIVRSSNGIQNILSTDENIEHCTIEIRPKGIIVLFTGALASHAWLIPYSKVSVYKNETGYSVFSDEQFIEVESQTTKATASFFNRLIEKSAVHHQEYAL